MSHNNCSTHNKAQKIIDIDYPRIGHRSVLYKNQLMMIGGTSEMGNYHGNILVIDLNTLNSKLIVTDKILQMQGFSIFTTADHLYFWGGITAHQASNTLWSFNGRKIIQETQTGTIPEPRGFHGYADINKKYTLIYGGWNYNTIFNDWYIMNKQTHQWIHVKTDIKLFPSQYSKLVWKNGQGFLMSNSGNSSANFQLHRIKFRNLQTFQLSIEQIQLNEHQLVTTRANPQIYLEQNSLYVFGGENISHKDIELYDDISIYNIQTLDWQDSGMKLQSKSGFQVTRYQQYFVINGGIKNKARLSTQIDFLKRNYDKNRKIISCKMCQYPFIAKQTNKTQLAQFMLHQQPNQYNFSICSQFIRKISQNFQDPYHALFYFINTLVCFQPKQIKFKTVQIQQNRKYFKNNKHYLQVKLSYSIFNDLTQVQLYKIHQCFNMTESHPYAVNIKIGAFFLGKSYLFVNKNKNNQIFIGYVSSTGLQSAYNQSISQCFAYTIDKNRQISSTNDRIIIKQNVSNFINQKSYTEIENNQTKLYILDFYGEYKQIMKISENDDRKISKIMEWANTYYLQNINKIMPKIYIDQEQLKYDNLKAIIKQKQQKGQIRSVVVKFPQNVNKIKQLKIFEVKAFAETSHSKYIYLYHQKLFITKLPIKCDTFWGYAQLNQNVNVGMLRDRLIYRQNYLQIAAYLQNQIKVLINPIFPPTADS